MSHATQKRNRAARRSRGLCIDCPNPSTDHVRCAPCREKARLRQVKPGSKAALVAARRQAGLCVECGRSAVAGRRKCRKHLRRDVHDSLARQAASIAAGRCTVCGLPATHGAGTKAPVCDKHWETRKAMQKRYYDRVAAEAKTQGLTYEEWRRVRGRERKAA